MFGTFRKAMLVSAIVAATGLSFAGYCAALIDWVEDVRTGVYVINHLEAFWETFALGLYTFLAFRFLRGRISLF